MGIDIVKKRIVSKLLIEMACGAFDLISKFASWLLAVFSAAFTLIIVNVEDFAKFYDV